MYNKWIKRRTSNGPNWDFQPGLKSNVFPQSTYFEHLYGEKWRMLSPIGSPSVVIGHCASFESKKKS